MNFYVGQAVRYKKKSAIDSELYKLGFISSIERVEGREAIYTIKHRNNLTIIGSLWEHELEALNLPDENRIDAINEAWKGEPEKEASPKVLEEALGLVYGDRGVAYGHPAVDYQRTAKLWGAILGIEMTAVQAIQCMIAMKLSRLCNTPDHRDSWVDVGGYAECGWRTVEYEKGNLDS